MLQIRHQVPGRVRFRIRLESGPLRSMGAADRSGIGGLPGGRVARMYDLKAALERERGVRGVRLNAACASVVVHYDPGLVTPERLCAVMEPRSNLPQADGRSRARNRRKMLAARRAANNGGGRQFSAGRGGERGRRALGCRLCRIQRRLMAWLVHSTLRCWWREWHMVRIGRGGTRLPRGGGVVRGPGLSGARRHPARWQRAVAPSSNVDMPKRPPLLTRLRERLGDGKTGYPVFPITGQAAAGG